MRKKRQANLHYMMMFPFCQPILLIGIRTGNVMGNTNSLKEGIKVVVFPSLVRLNKDFLIKEPFNKVLEILKLLEYLGFVLEQVNPSEFSSH
jgi:hypothetical protein